MNGKRGVATDFHPMDDDDGATWRYTVKLDGGEAFKLKRANVRGAGGGGGRRGQRRRDGDGDGDGQGEGEGKEGAQKIKPYVKARRWMALATTQVYM